MRRCVMRGCVVQGYVCYVPSQYRHFESRYFFFALEKSLPLVICSSDNRFSPVVSRESRMGGKSRKGGEAGRERKQEEGKAGMEGKQERGYVKG